MIVATVQSGVWARFHILRKSSFVRIEAGVMESSRCKFEEGSELLAVFR